MGSRRSVETRSWRHDFGSAQSHSVITALRSIPRGRGGSGGDLCPHCGLALEGRPSSCPRCLTDFERPWIAASLSLLVPGLGNHYPRHRFFAVLELLLAAALWIAYLFGAEIWGYPEIRSAVGPEWIFAAVHGGGTWTWYVARTGIYPRDES